GLAPGTTVVVPTDEPLLAPHLRDDLRTVTYGGDGDVRLEAADGERVTIAAEGERIELEVDFSQAHFRLNLLAAVAAALAIGVRPSGGEAYSVADAGEAAALVPELLAPGDTVHVQASRGIGLEVVAEALSGAAEASA